jgi:hypothetical protein
MAKFFSKLNADHIDFIQRQHLFFVATGTPSSRINLSPKGLDTFRIIDPKRVAYLDLTGSGNETAAHLHHDGRMTIMLCGFEGEPLILRLYGQGHSVVPRDADWEALITNFEPLPGTRQIIEMTVESVQTSCGYAVPYYSYKGDRDRLNQWAAKRGSEGLQKYWKEKNQTSIDGLPTGLISDYSARDAK